MAGSLIREARRGALSWLKADPAVTAIIASPSIYPGKQPANAPWPFVRWGGPTSLPIEAACVAGATVTFFIHAFAKVRLGAGGRVLETAEDYCCRIHDATVVSLRGKRIPLDGGLSAMIRWRSSQVMMDGDEPDAYHGVATFDARILAR